MGLRRADAKVDLPPPPSYPGCISVSVVLHLGGECIHVPPAQYVGGKIIIYDHVNTDLIDFWTLAYLLRQEGISDDEVAYYLKVGDTFELIDDEKTLQDAATNCIRQRLFHIYVSQTESNSEFEIGNMEGDMEGDGADNSSEDVEKNMGKDDVGDNESESEGRGVDMEDNAGLDDLVERAATGEYDFGNDTIGDAERYLIRDHDDDIEQEGDAVEGNTGEDELFLESEYLEDQDWDELIDGYRDDEEPRVIAGGQGDQAGGSGMSGKGKELAIFEECDSSDVDMVTVGDDFDERRLSDEENDGSRPAPVFNTSEIYKPTITLEMLFGTRDEFRKAVRSLAVMEKRMVKFTRTTPSRVYAKCQAKGCKWNICAHKVQDAESLQVTRFESTHTCTETSEVPVVNSTWLAERFIQKFVSDPKRSAEGFRLDVIKKLKVNVTKHQAIAAKRKALKSLQGSSEYQFSKLWDYAEELRKRNPGSTIIVGTSDEAGQTRFDRFYACFAALKKGWRLGCRPIIGVDGCHLSGPHKGILLTAVGVDPNNQLYPIAYAIIPIENRDNWGWFLSVLKGDLQLENVRYLTFISDRQKGLVQAMQEVMPGVDHRFCVRHMHNNFCTAGYRGLALKNLLWSAARAGTVPEFIHAMKKVEEYSKDNLCAWKWLCERPPTQWSKSHFSEGPMCDMLLNNLCESFNSCIKEARDKTILTSLEWIREYIMKRHADHRDRARIKWSNKLICPRIEGLLKKHAQRVGNCIPVKASDRHYQIRMMEGDGQFVVDLVKRECCCRLWQLNGYPCLHAVAAIYKQGNDPINYVEKFYSVATYTKAYQHPIIGMSSDTFWHPTGFIPPCPPNFGRGVGRPPKSRKTSVDEPKKKQRPRRRQTNDPTKMTRRGTTSHCSSCGEPGHHVTTCPNQPEEVLEQRRQAKARGQNGHQGAGPSSGGTLARKNATATPKVSKFRTAPKNSVAQTSAVPQGKSKKSHKKAPPQHSHVSQEPRLLLPNPTYVNQEQEELMEEPVITQEHIMLSPPLIPGPSIQQQIKGKGAIPTKKAAPTKGGSWRVPQFRVGTQGPPTHNLRSMIPGGSKQ